MTKQNNDRGKQGLPSTTEILEFIQDADGPAGKREIAKAFGIKGQDKIALKKRLKDMAEEGLIDGRKTAYHRMGGLPKVTVLKVVEIEDGEPIAEPETWPEDAPGNPPRLTVKEGKKVTALKRGDRFLARTEEKGKGWVAHPMKKLPARTEGLMGVVEFDGSGKPWLAPVDKRVRNSAPISELGGAEEGELVLCERTGKSARSSVKVIEVVGDPLAPGSFSLIAIAKHGIPHIFPQEALDEAQAVTDLPLSEEKREDLRDVPIVAIDPADARDHDDAIWAEPDGEGGYRAIVAIADVSYYVRPGGALDREARKRGNSVYFPDRVVPMLPEILSADICSLVEDEDRAAMACHLHISADGTISKWRFTRAIVRLAANIAYEDAQKAIDDGSAPENLKNLWGAWDLLFKARNARDPLDLDMPERQVKLNDEGRIAEIALRERLDAHRVVEDFMIAANVAAAKALEAKKAPVVYRVHEVPSREKLIAFRDYIQTQGRKFAMGQVITPGLFNRMIKDIADPAEKALIMEAVLRSQTQAYYGPTNAGHFGLALGSYAHFTSPIRRYADLLVHPRAGRRIWAGAAKGEGRHSRRHRSFRTRQDRAWPDHRCHQSDRAPRDGGGARYDRPLCRGLSCGTRWRNVQDPDYRGAGIRILRHDRRARRRRTGSGIDAGPRILPLRGSSANAGGREQRHAIRRGRPARAQACRSQCADRRAQVRSAGQRGQADREARHSSPAQEGFGKGEGGTAPKP